MTEPSLLEFVKEAQPLIADAAVRMPLVTLDVFDFRQRSI